MDYVNKFYNLECSRHVKDVVLPIFNFKKEITESWAMIKLLRKIVLKNTGKFKYDLYDLCAGNALTSVLSAFLLPVNNVYAVDHAERKRNWDDVNKFEYINEDIFNFNFDHVKNESIMIAVHPCCELATCVCDIYNRCDNIKHLLLMPCCIGSHSRKHSPLIPNGYYAWSLYLSNLVDGKEVIDTQCLSPKNVIIIASKK